MKTDRKNMKHVTWLKATLLCALTLGVLWTQPGFTQDASRIKKAALGPEFFGHVTLVEGYDLAGFKGCHALIALRDSPGTTVAVITRSHALQTLLETGLATGNLVSIRGARLNPSPPLPRGGTWAVPVYDFDGVILYNTK